MTDYPLAPWVAVVLVVVGLVIGLRYHHTEVSPAAASLEDDIRVEPQAELLAMVEDFNNERKPVIKGRIITGQIIDDRDLIPLPGVYITVKNQQSGTLTDTEGRFSLSVAPDTEILLVDFIGFQKEEIVLSKKSNYVVGLTMLPSRRHR